MKLFFCSAIILALSGCGFIAQQIREKNREDYLLKNLGASDPRLAKNTQYANLEFKFLSKYSVKHDWPKGFWPCQYSTIDLPLSQQNGYWYGSYDRLGDIFEYKDKTLQEIRVNGYPKRSIRLAHLSIDEYVRSDKYVHEGKVKDGGLKSICRQIFLGSHHILTIRLRKWTKKQWQEKMIKSYPDAKLTTQRVGNNEWIVQKAELKPVAFRRVTGKFESWMLPIGDTGYTFYFDLGASTESQKRPRRHQKMKKIFKHLIESVKIEPLSEQEASQARAKVKKLTREIDTYEAKYSTQP